MLPDLPTMQEHAHELKGIVLTHGHEDHVGALPYLLRSSTYLSYASKLTLGLVRTRSCEDFRDQEGDLRGVKAENRQNLGGFRAGVRKAYSIPGAVAVAINCQGRMICSRATTRSTF